MKRLLGLALVVCAQIFAQSAAPLPLGKPQFFDNNGYPLSGGQIYFCVAGSSCPGTPLASYTDSTAGTPNANPVVLDAAGRAAIWIGSATYKIVAQDSTGNTLWTQDNVSSSAIATGATFTGSNGATLIKYTASGTGAASRTVASKLGDTVSVKDFGAVCDGSTDDSAAVQAAATAASGVQGVVTFPGAKTCVVSNATVSVPAGVTLDLNGATILNTSLTTPISLGAAAVLRNGTVQWTNTGGNSISTVKYLDMVRVADDCRVENIRFLGSGGVGVSGTALLQRAVVWAGSNYPGFATSANRVIVRGSYFSNMTVGVWAGGSSTDGIVYGWKVVNNAFENIVGTPNNSEGYGVLFTPASYGLIQGNTFRTIERHSIYLAGGAAYNEVAENNIYGDDNVAIQLNTFNTQPGSNWNHIHDNTISHVTKNFAYGFVTSIAIGCFTNGSHNIIEHNNISDFQEIGIWVSSTDGSNVIWGVDNQIIGNSIYATVGTPIQTDNPDGYLIARNKVSAPSGGTGINQGFTVGVAPAKASMWIDNDVYGISGSVTGIHLTSTGVANWIAGNRFIGVSTPISDAGSGNIKSQIDNGSNLVVNEPVSLNITGSNTALSAQGLGLYSTAFSFADITSGLSLVSGALQFSTGTGNVASLLGLENGLLNFYNAISTGVGNAASVTQQFSVNATGTANAKTGFAVNGTAGLTVVKNVKGSDGNNCTETFTGGILTASTCP